MYLCLNKINISKVSTDLVLEILAGDIYDVIFHLYVYLLYPKTAFCDLLNRDHTERR